MAALVVGAAAAFAAAFVGRHPIRPPAEPPVRQARPVDEPRPVEPKTLPPEGRSS
jgi:hypothetical protein